MEATRLIEDLESQQATGLPIVAPRPASALFTMAVKRFATDSVTIPYDI